MPERPEALPAGVPEEAMTPAAAILTTHPDLTGDLPEPEARPTRNVHDAMDLICEAEEMLRLAMLDLEPGPVRAAINKLALAEAELRRYRA